MSLSANATHILDDFIECTRRLLLLLLARGPLPLVPSNPDVLDSDRRITYRTEDTATGVGRQGRSV